MAEFNPNVIGALEIGVLMSVLLHGVVSMQAYSYFANFPKDPKVLKLAVTVIWTSATAHVICIAWGVYIMTITNYGLAPQLIGIPRVVSIAAGFGAFTHSFVQSIYIYRMYKFSGRLYIPILCWAISAYNLVGGVVFTATVPIGVFSELIEYENKWAWLIYSLFASTAFVDVVIAASLCYFLRKSRLHGMKKTARLVDKLMVWTIQTGLMTSITAIAVVITFAANKENNAWLGLYFFLTNLYPAALFALLNGRTGLKADEAFKMKPTTVSSLTSGIQTTDNGTIFSTYGIGTRLGQLQSVVLADEISDVKSTHLSAKHASWNPV